MTQRRQSVVQLLGEGYFLLQKILKVLTKVDDAVTVINDLFFNTNLKRASFGDN